MVDNRFGILPLVIGRTGKNRLRKCAANRKMSVSLYSMEARPYLQRSICVEVVHTSLFVGPVGRMRTNYTTMQEALFNYLRRPRPFLECGTRLTVIAPPNINADFGRRKRAHPAEFEDRAIEKPALHPQSAL